MKVEYIDSKDRKYSKAGIVKMTTCGNVIELMEFERVNRRGSAIMKLSDDYYCRKVDFNADTGEIGGEGIKEFQRTENRAQNMNGLAKSMKTVRDLINCNVIDPKNCRWLTLTYAENMTDTKRLYKDRQQFWQRVLWWHKQNGLEKPEYISIVEPQGRGAWHLHELWLYPSKAPFLPNETIREIWRQGFITVKKLDDVDNVGAYLTAYLCDVPLEEAAEHGIDPRGMEIKIAEVKQEDGTKIEKKYIKGARLNLYPNKMNFYRTSRNVKRPSVEWLNAERAKEKVSSAKLTFSKTIRLTDDEYSNDIHYEYYNTVRGKCQELEMPAEGTAKPHCP